MASATSQGCRGCEELTHCNYCVACGFLVRRHGSGGEVEEEDSRLFAFLSSLMILPDRGGFSSWWKGERRSGSAALAGRTGAPSCPLRCAPWPRVCAQMKTCLWQRAASSKLAFNPEKSSCFVPEPCRVLSACGSAQRNGLVQPKGSSHSPSLELEQQSPWVPLRADYFSRKFFKNRSRALSGCSSLVLDTW